MIELIGPSDRCTPIYCKRTSESVRNAGGLCCDPSEMRVPYVPRRARGVQQKCGWILLRPFRNASALCSTQGPQGPSEKRVDFIETLQKCECLMFHTGPQKSNRNHGALEWTPIFGSKNAIMHAEVARPIRNAQLKKPPNCMATPPRRPAEGGTSGREKCVPYHLYPLLDFSLGAG